MTLCKRFIIGCVFALVVVFASACSSSQGSEADSAESSPKFVDVATAGTGGAYYPIGISIAEILSNNLEVNATAQTTGGAVENVTLVQGGEVNIGITQSPMAVAGYEGSEPYEQKNEGIATLFNGISQGIFQLVTRDSSGIESPADLKGKKVVLGPAGGGAINVVRDILSVYDLKVDDLDATYVSYSEGVSMLSDNNVDAVIVQAAAPSPAVTEYAASNNDLNVVSISSEKIEELLDKFSYLNQTELPEEMYNTEESTNTVYLTNMMIVQKDLDEEFVYNMTKQIFENLEKVQSSHPAAEGLTLESAAQNPPIPFHPGAKKYFEEQGVLE